MGASFGSGRNERRHRSSNERETPYCRAVAATWRGACKLSRTILSFSSSDQRRRRPVSTTSSRLTWSPRLSLSIRTVLNSAPHSARRPPPDAYLFSECYPEVLPLRSSAAFARCSLRVLVEVVE